MSWQEEAQSEMWDAIAEQDSRRSVEAAKEAELETDDGAELVAEVVGALLGARLEEEPRTVRLRDERGFGYELEPDRPTLPELLGNHEEAERRATVAGYPWHVIGGTGRTVAAFRDEAGARHYAGLHPAFTVEERKV